MASDLRPFSARRPSPRASSASLLRVQSDYARGGGASRLGLGDSERESIAAAWRRAWARASPPGSRWPFGARGTSSTERGSASATSWAARPRPTRSSRSAPTRRRSRPPLVAPGGRGRDHARRHGDGAGARRRARAIVEDHRSRPLGAPIGLFDYASWVELPGDDGLRAMMLGAFASNEVSTGSIARVFGRASAQQNPSVLGTVGSVTARGGRIV
jgi:hypothetical protein